MPAPCCRLACLLVFGLSAVAIPAAIPAAAAERPVNIVMEDQFRNRCETGQMRGDVVVLVYAGRKGAEAAL